MAAMAPTSVTRRAATRRRRAAIEQAILGATEVLLEDRAFRDLTVEDVMGRAGMTRTAFYRYFPDLQAVLLRQLLQVRDELGAAADLWLAGDADPTAGLLVASTALAVLFEDHGRLLLALADAAAGSPDVEVAWHATVQSFVEPVHRRIVELQRRGLAQVADAGQTAAALVWMTERYLLESFGRSRSVAVDVAADTLATIWRRALFSDG